LHVNDNQPGLTANRPGEIPAGERNTAASTLKTKAPWYKGGAIYELHVRAFHDSDGDGTGDFRGLTSKLDYLQGLGVTALWLLPFYPSPLKDDGYDISDYCGVHSKYGTLADFKVFLREAHRRGLRVITELVINHTSDQHPWFQRARRARPGSRWRNYYVWNDTPDKYKGTRIIFKDTETSNWAWDPVAKAYYWHRFYSHQPDLNFDHPEVHQEIFKALDFWLGLGVDGLRLDAVPYLYEREGTNCENLPETHEFLKRLRKHVDKNYGDRMLLAEANQWPDDAAAYFGSGRGDECHMAFHFPLMPRLFMSLQMEDRIPIVDILEQTPPIPETAQWALFLRNHDELTLEMVTDEERDYMYRMYAHIHQARLNLGIRRRLAPLVGNDRKRVELLSALLFSLPGTPVIYYGDEIGMGENIYLGDRNGVRTPMQWSADKNAGFSRANPQSLYLPINLDPENHYEAVNVEVQERNPHSLLWWMKRMISLHKRWKAFGLGTLEFLHPENRKVLACVRRYQNECLLVVANLSRFVQPVKLDLSTFQSLVPVELFGRTEFPAISDKPYFLTLGPHAFYWFALESQAPARAESAGAPVGSEARAILTVDNDWQEVLDENNHVQLEQALRGWLPSRRWFGGKARRIRSVHIKETIPVTMGAEKAFLVFLQVDYLYAESEMYCLPLACAFGEKADEVCLKTPALVLAHLTLNQSNKDGVLYDAIGNRTFCLALLALIQGRRIVPGELGELAPTRTAVLRRLHGQDLRALEPALSKAEQNNSSVIYGDRLILKFFRRLDAGPNPDLEIARFLTEHDFPHTPPLAGALEYRGRNEDSITVAILTSFVPGCKDAWVFTLDTLGRFFERVQTVSAADTKALLAHTPSITRLPPERIPPGTAEMIGTYLENARIIGERTAELHRALASETEDRDFAPEPFTAHDQRSLYQSMRNLARRNFQLLNQRLKSLPADTQGLAQQVLGLESKILNRFRAIYERRLDAARIRYHGDYHLGQLLYTGKDFLIIDFEGEPALAIGERRLKQSPLRDIAGMIRSFHYAAHAALERQAEFSTLQTGRRKELESWARFWSRWVSVVFYSSYRQAAGVVAFLPANNADLQLMMDAYLLRKAVYELGYELTDRPDWVWIPLQAILELVNLEGAP
jgi:maltose alpha-D-glucosyltransferase/alpha-amylase